MNTGTVQFSDGSTALGGPVSLAADGTATLTTNALDVGSHTITAAYTGDADHAASSGSATQVVRPIADAGGPYTVAEGSTLSLSAGTSTAGAAVEWDVNGDGDYSDATGTAPTLTWDQLEALGIDDGPGSFPVSVRVTLDGTAATAAATLTVTNTVPTATTTGATTATARVPFTIKIGADDPSSADMAASFTYTVNWGDGGAVETVTGAADPPVTHTYTTAGAYTASFTATDKDGGTSGTTTVIVQVAPAPAGPTAPPSPSPSPSRSSHAPSLPVTGGQLTAAPVAIGVLAILAGLGALAAGHRRRTG